MEPSNSQTTSDLSSPSNPLLAAWKGPFDGTPPFDAVAVMHFKPALEAAMAEKLAEVDVIAADTADPSFANTLEALERSGRTLDRVLSVYSVWSSTMNSPDFQSVEREMAPRLAAFSDQIIQHEALFRRIEAVYQSPVLKTLSPEQQRLAWKYYTSFVRAGARLDATGKARLSRINQQLAGLFTEFNQHLLADEMEGMLVLEHESDLAGLPPSMRDAAAAAAKKNHAGRWVIPNTRSSIDPFLTYSDRRDLREKAWRLFFSRGDNGNANDNKTIITEILQLRAERAKLLGYTTHAHWRLELTMAKTPERVMELLAAVWQPAVARVHEEVSDMQALADQESAGIQIEPWDYRYYAEKVRKARYDLDQDKVRQYLQLEKLREGMFWVAGELFGLGFTPVSDTPVYHPEVRVWEVRNGKTDEHIGHWFFDAWARDGKKSGAWMSAYRSQEKMDGAVPTIVSNNCNYIKGNPDEPVLISWDDAKTLFHEFGHALHGLCSDVTYPSLSGTAVVRDYVEFPSQLLEHWLSTPEVLQRFARHHQTGEPIPQSLVDRLHRASTFNEGFATTEYLACALIDMKLHLAGDQQIDPAAFERDTLRELGMPHEIVMRHRTPQFAHAFGSDGYSAGYYSYLWADVLTADAWEAFTDAGGPYDREVAGRLKQHVFATGNTVDPEAAYRAFRGHDPQIEALMRKRGFPIEPSSPGIS